MAPIVHHALFHVGVIGCRAFHKRLNGKNDFRMLSGEVPSASRCTSLNNYGTALRGRGHMQRATRTKEPPDMVDTVDFRGISKDPSGAVHDQGIVVPALPQLVAHLEKLVSAIVAPVVLLGFVIALDSLMTIGKRHDIPAHPPTRQ